MHFLLIQIGKGTIYSLISIVFSVNMWKTIETWIWGGGGTFYFPLDKIYCSHCLTCSQL